MSEQVILQVTRRRSRPNALRRGSTLTELVVAAVLISTMVSFAAKLVVSSSRMWQQTRHVQLAMDELSNHMDRLISLDAGDRRNAMNAIELSDEIKTVIPEASITSQIIRDSDGVRLQLSLNWDHKTGTLPVTLIGWIDSTPGSDDEAKE